MRKETYVRYVCEICNHKYIREEEALACEGKPAEAVPREFIHGSSILLRNMDPLKNGRIIKFAIPRPLPMAAGQNNHHRIGAAAILDGQEVIFTPEQFTIVEPEAEG